jgi:A/G-specific adenine glycosylase
MKPVIKTQESSAAERKKNSAPPRLRGFVSFHRPLVAWFKKNGRDLPWRHARNPYAVLVSEIMLQQTQVVTVVDFFTRWMARFPDFAALAAASEADVLQVWQGLGYYSRARNLHRAAKIIVAEHGGKMPRELDAIRALPGIGRYTAGAVATFAFDQSTPIIDANIARVLARIFDIRTPVDTAVGQAALWQIAEDLQPQKKAGMFNEALMELGALVCQPRQPKCDICAVKKFCRADEPETLPVKKPRRKTVALAERCVWIVKNGRILLEQQTGLRWRGLWKLPGMRSAECGTRNETPLLKIVYPFTHHRVTLSIFSAPAPKTPAANQQWFKIRELEKAALAAPHRRAILKLNSEKK